MKKILFTLFSLTAAYILSAQSIQNVDFYVSRQNIIITYDFTGTASNQRYDLQLYVSINNNTWRGPLTYVSGDIGTAQSGGYSKRITWNALQEYTEVEGNLSFKITAKCTSGCNTNDGDMIFIEGGTFSMGSNEYDDEKPIHSVTVSSFYMGKYEVTQKQWREVMGQDPPELNFKGCDQCPVERVSWNDIQEFLKKLNAKTGKNYRLPTEAEWEYAARGGKSYKYAGSDNIGSVAWYSDNSDSKTHPVGQKSANGYGLYDMSGNVWEWCSDWYNSDYYKNSPSDNPKGPSTSSIRVLRGGSWISGAAGCRSADRYFSTPDYRHNNYGFRLAL
jgi:formylglycine-generating enzyme required for sulfatase activity